jgi:formate-dependent phosphoribosylglycinamide formyltransferase (GAR transformylase)
MIRKKILILGANEYQTTLIIRAKALGLHTVVCDPRLNVPGVKLADTYYNVDCFDIEKVTGAFLCF